MRFKHLQFTKILTMASSFLCTLSLLSFLLLFTSSFQTSSVNSLRLPSVSSEKVSLALYYETLCPGSEHFIIDLLPTIFKNGLISIVDLHFSPWGNAKLLRNETFHCQHGEMECMLNTIEACAIDAWPNVDKHYQFIYCVELLAYNEKSTDWETCFNLLSLDRTPIDECYSSGHGTKLELGYAKETAALEPPHKYVPWVTVNGQPLYEDYEQFMSYICKAYKGSPLPKACNDLPVIKKGPVSYEETYSRSAKFTRAKKKLV